MSVTTDVAGVERRIDAIASDRPVVSRQSLGAGPVASAAFGRMLTAASAATGVDPELVAAVARAESGFDPAAMSASGAQGVMQLMPQTARELGVADPYDPAANIKGGATYLRELLDRFGGNVRLAVAAYNAGPGAVERYGGVPPYAETQAYVARVLGSYLPDSAR